MKRPRGFRADEPLSYFEAERQSAALRRVIVEDLLDGDIERMDALPGVKVFEVIDDLVVTVNGRDIPLDCGTKRMPVTVEARTIYLPEDDRIAIELSEATYRALKSDIPRARFCLFHELSHAEKHGAQLVRLGEIPHEEAALLRGRWATHKFYEDTEWQADVMAACMLMPASALARLQKRHGVLTPELLMNTFGVSFTSAKIRITTFNQRRDELLRACGRGETKRR